MRALLLLSLTLLACRHPGAGPTARQTGPARPKTREACLASPCRGEWKVHGMVQKETCVCRTTDGGGRCTDGDQCQGVCIADGMDREVVTEGPPPRGFWVGRCSDFEAVFGCWKVIAKGASQHGPQILGSGPDETCVD